MKRPLYGAFEKQEQVNAGLNAFALELVAESYADDPTKFKGGSICCVNHAHNGQQVFIVIMSELPEEWVQPRVEGL